MEKDDENVLLDHDADGIKEYDNSLPKWWLYMFYVTILASVVYMYYYHVYDGKDWNVLWYTQKTQVAEYEHELANAKSTAPSPLKTNSAAVVLLTDEESLKRGKGIYEGMENACSTCHRQDLGGQVGPNLTDEYWIHGCTLNDVMTSIKTGFPEKGMLPYGMNTRLSDEDLLKVASYVMSKQGSQPEQPKAIEEGREILCPNEQQLAP